MKNNTMSILSLVLSIVSLAISFVWPDVNTVTIMCTICLLFAIAGIIMGFMGRKQIKTSNEKGKGLALAGIIIGFISAIFNGMAIFGSIAMKNIDYNDMSLCTMDNVTKDCVDNGDGTSTCKYMNSYEIPCSTDKLKESQFK